MFSIQLKQLIVYVFLLLISSSIYANETLIFALDLIRHGDRTPLLTIPNAPHTWVEGMGQLTPLGMQQEWHHGIEFRKKYIDHSHLLPPRFQHDTLYVFSTNVDRTLMSAQAVLMGLYPLGTGPVLPGSRKPALPRGYQPIPIHPKLMEGSSEIMVDNDITHGKQEALRYLASQPAWIQKTQELQNKFPAWSAATGLSLTGLHQLVALADTLYIDQLYHVPMPAHLSAEDVKQIVAAGSWAFVTAFQTKEIATIVGSPFVTAITSYIQNASQQKTPLKYVLLSAHDDTIMSVMTILQAPLDAPPPYASDVNFSLFKTDTAGDIVKVTYNGKPVALRGCLPTYCALAQFIALAAGGRV
ncbi:MAG: map [Gammaproteobacteria bacterium]|jgi:acid phosphatase|nr:map [Gammaproteobacteria bacterium]